MNEWEKLPRPWIADIGSGGYPWPFANILVDRYPGDTHHRSGERHHGRDLATDGRLFIQADICELPFGDHSLDFVIASHVLEHVDDPLRALEELQRVSSKGVAWVPSVLAQIAAHLVTKGKPTGVGHKWLVVNRRGLTFRFFEFDDSDPVVVEWLLKTLGHLQGYADMGYGTEIRIPWGWGAYHSKVKADQMELVIQKGPQCQS